MSKLIAIVFVSALSFWPNGKLFACGDGYPAISDHECLISLSSFPIETFFIALFLLAAVFVFKLLIVHKSLNCSLIRLFFNLLCAGFSSVLFSIAFAVGIATRFYVFNDYCWRQAIGAVAVFLVFLTMLTLLEYFTYKRMVGSGFHITKTFIVVNCFLGLIVVFLIYFFGAKFIETTTLCG